MCSLVLQSPISFQPGCPLYFVTSNNFLHRCRRIHACAASRDWMWEAGRVRVRVIDRLCLIPYPFSQDGSSFSHLTMKQTINQIPCSFPGNYWSPYSYDRLSYIYPAHFSILNKMWLSTICYSRRRKFIHEPVPLVTTDTIQLLGLVHIDTDTICCVLA